ncbi:Transmembrane protein [Quillaja saponaria]|uniref:Transmembrane protein n=1 Tax=Quillaja saponaria TaxID=32244 RepID=A0AAD7PS91_QUISA|nr:Transmembrane protein [Quillaja saponaria]
MEPGATCRKSKFSSFEKLVAIGLALLAVASPLYIDRNPVSELEVDEEPINLASWLPLLLVVLILAITVSGLKDQSITRFDHYWIHRVGGSSVGLTVILMVLFLVLKCKASVRNWEA